MLWTNARQLYLYFATPLIQLNGFSILALMIQARGHVAQRTSIVSVALTVGRFQYLCATLEQPKCSCIEALRVQAVAKVIQRRGVLRVILAELILFNADAGFKYARCL